jgi:xanthine dehydrogenase accessory factor
VAFFDRITALRKAREPFAVATVVARRAPVSSHLGDRALVLADGRMEGFVGGSCSRDIVRREALAAMRTGKPRLVQIRPDAAEGGEIEAGRVVVPMGCASEGAVDVYVEPFVEARSLLVVGFTPVAGALARHAALLDYRVVRVVAGDEAAEMDLIEGAAVVALDGLREHIERIGPAERSRLVAVVASQGHYDESALETILPAEPAFVGLLASRKRAARVAGVLAQQGIAQRLIDTIRNPVGLDIGARKPGEVAVSVLAEIIAATPALDETGDPETPAPAHADPVCGMTVDAATAREQAVHHGRRYFFCCAHCRAAFVAEPERYLEAAQTT